MKKTMQAPEMEFIRFQSADVIVTSGMTGLMTYPGDEGYTPGDSAYWAMYYNGFEALQ